MKRIFLTLVATCSLLAAATAIAKTSSLQKGADCCGGNACCAAGNACCE